MRRLRAAGGVGMVLDIRALQVLPYTIDAAYYPSARRVAVRRRPEGYGDATRVGGAAPRSTGTRSGDALSSIVNVEQSGVT